MSLHRHEQQLIISRRRQTTDFSEHAHATSNGAVVFTRMLTRDSNLNHNAYRAKCGYGVTLRDLSGNLNHYELFMFVN